VVDNTTYIREKELPYDKLKSNFDDESEDRILFRSRNNYMFAGVIGGLAHFWEMDSTTLRLIFLALSVLTGGLALIIYLVLIKALPLAPEA
jgi:phage shock protein PspC (stress-responsive transcriptional regulator)